jgi:hypothetical protein
MKQKWNTYRILVGKPEGKGPQRILSSRLKNNIKINFTGIGWGGMDWIGVASDRDK